MALFLGIVLALVSLAVVVAPFVRRQVGRRDGPPTDPLAALVARRQAIYEEIKALRLEHSLGHIGDEEYQRRFHDYRLQAALLLREQRLLEEEVQRLDQGLEEEVRALRQRRKRRARVAARHAQAEEAPE